ncbi:hypothetical protein GFS31_40600 (plasmid) [Leptolyngbya sp. BL0902]|uniref:hypothetical protein n=1 Tax=Leptolyngbya sp. BL0902 TaxID=1115757 RepID=UPI0018E82B97|nr:hypothetical protein [Leptolyngbya sp. BL0902]QQE67347.1 hypothetical protein GFS31_40600 [Leptolyngbya sp. BL0902]
MTKTHGWLWPELLRLDSTYQGRYECWHQTKTQPHLTLDTLAPPEPIPFLKPGEAGFDRTLAMLNACCKALGGNRQTPGMQEVRYLAQWMLFSLGHPYQKQPPKLDCGIAGARRKRLENVFDLSLLIRFPSDYFGHLLARSRYGQKHTSFYPTLQPVAQLMTELGQQVNQRAKPVRLFDPCLGTGRLALEASNQARALVGWERDRPLLEVALANFMLYAPDFALPIPGLGGQLVWGDALERQGTVIVGTSELPDPWPALEPPSNPRSSTKRPEIHDSDSNQAQLRLF